MLPELMAYISARSPDTQLTIYTSLTVSDIRQDIFARAVEAYTGRLLVAVTMHYAQQSDPAKQSPVWWGKVETVAHRLRAMETDRREVHISIQPTASEDQRAHFHAAFGPAGDRIHSEAATIQSWFGLVNDRNTDELAPLELPGPRGACHRPFSDTFMVLHDGTCVACCQDVVIPEYIVGDANETPLMDIWHGEPMVSLREAHLVGDVSHIAPCNKCRQAPTPKEH
jgi:radical SAM protein with 4Fe4S-binding SPASM domain